MNFRSILRNRYTVVLTLALLAHMGVFYGFSRTEIVPIARPLSGFPQSFDGWTQVQEGLIDQETRDILKADDLLSRTYKGYADFASLFVAYFETQRTGRAPHSPKNCLPGNGWTPSRAEIISIDVPGEEPISANRYIVARGNDKSVVIYWYQSQRRTVASEYRAKIYTVTDAIRYNRSDTALVRVVVGARNGDEEAASAIATRFARDAYKMLRGYLPS